MLAAPCPYAANYSSSGLRSGPCMIQRIKQLVRPYRWLQYMLRNGHLTFEELKHGRLHFSQFGEDVILEAFSPKKKDGFYVDIGAFHPVLLSNTCLFYKKGWRGINVEPNPYSLQEFHRQRPRDINLNLAVSDKAGFAEFTCDGPCSGLLTVAEGQVDSTRKRSVVRVETLPLTELLGIHLPEGTEIDFLSIDCEGHDLVVLQSNNWNKYRPRLVLVEDLSGRVDGDLSGFMKSVGYHFYCKTGLTEFFIERGSAEAYLPAVF